MDRIRKFLNREEGQDLIEYALLGAFIAIVTIATLRVMGTKVAAFYTMLGAQL